MTKNDKKNGSFAVNLGNHKSTAAFYKEQFLREVDKYPQLTVDGEDWPPVRSGINEAGANNLITVGTSDRHDVSWIRRPGFACERGIKPIYDIVEDWNEAKTSLRNFVNNKYGFRLPSGMKVQIHESFVRIGSKICPKYTENGDTYIVIEDADIRELNALVNKLNS